MTMPVFCLQGALLTLTADDHTYSPLSLRILVGCAPQADTVLINP